MDKGILIELINEGFSSRKVAARIGRSQTTTIYWLRKYGLRTKHPYHERTTPIRYCNNCGKELTTQKARVYCGNKCQQEFRWKLTKKRIEDSGSIDCTSMNLHKARKYLVEVNGWGCSICRRSKWRGEKIPLVCDHIDGNPYNNQIGNLRMVCANCDAQLPTYKSKNKGNGRKERKKRTVI